MLCYLYCFRKEYWETDDDDYPDKVAAEGESCQAAAEGKKKEGKETVERCLSSPSPPPSFRSLCLSH